MSHVTANPLDLGDVPSCRVPGIAVEGLLASLEVEEGVKITTTGEITQINTRDCKL